MCIYTLKWHLLEPGMVTMITADGYIYVLPCKLFKMVSSLSTAVLKCEMYWDISWALWWVSFDIASRLGDDCAIETESLFANPLLVSLVGLFDIEWHLVPLKNDLGLIGNHLESGWVEKDGTV